MPRLDDLPKAVRTKLLAAPVAVNDATPFTVPEGPLSERTLGLVTTGALHRRGDRPFVPDDHTFRVIPADVEHGDLLQSQLSIGFDRGLALRDLNVVFPRDRLRELVARGVIGDLGPRAYSLLGAQRSPERIGDETAGALARRLRHDGVELVLLTPT